MLNDLLQEHLMRYAVLMENRTKRFASHYFRRFGASLQEIRKHAGLTQADLAERMTDAGYPMSRVMVAKTEGATRPTSIEEMAAFSAVLGVPVTYLLPAAMTGATSTAVLEVLRASRLTAEGTAAGLLEIVNTLQSESARLQMRIDVLERDTSGLNPEAS